MRPTRHSRLWRASTARSDGKPRRLVLLTTAAETDYRAFAFQHRDVLMVGRESAGVPPEVHAAADARITIPLRPGFRSLNVAVAAAMVLGEALRQLTPAPSSESHPKAPAPAAAPVAKQA